MGKSPDEQPFLAAYKLRLAIANSKTTPLRLGTKNATKLVQGGAYDEGGVVTGQELPNIVHYILLSGNQLKSRVL